MNRTPEERLQALLPPWCVLAMRGDGFDPAPLVRAEELALLSAKAVERRRREFALGRATARLALLRAGCGDPAAVLKGAHGEPIWPRGWVGSISHASGIAAAAVAAAERADAVGLDVEDLTREVGAGFLEYVALEEERAWAEAGELQLRAKLLFSAKEAVFKAVFPVARVPLGFRDARIRWSSDAASFDGELLRHCSARLPAGARLQGRATVAGSLVATAVVVEPSMAC